MEIAAGATAVCGSPSHFSTNGDNWAYPRVAFAPELDLSAYDGLRFRVPHGHGRPRRTYACFSLSRPAPVTSRIPDCPAARRGALPPCCSRSWVTYRPRHPIPNGKLDTNRVAGTERRRAQQAAVVGPGGAQHPGREVLSQQVSATKNRTILWSRVSANFSRYLFLGNTGSCAPRGTTVNSCGPLVKPLRKSSDLPQQRHSFGIGPRSAVAVAVGFAEQVEFLEYSHRPRRSKTERVDP